MGDVAFLLLMLVFFAAAIAYARVASRLYRYPVGATSLILLLVAAALFAYLLYALLRPEKF